MKSQNITNFFIVPIMSTFISCDCVQIASGNIFDAETKIPIENARVQKVNKNFGEEKTDKSGYFKLKFIDGGLFGCPEMNVLIIKDGYYEKVVEMEVENKEIYLQRK